MPDSFNGDLPAAISALIPIILIVSAVDADIASEFAARRLHRSGVTRLGGWRLRGPLLFAWWMLITGFLALVIALLELRWRTNRYDWWMLGLAAFPVVGLHVHLAARTQRQLTDARRVDVSTHTSG
jgi:hypothetical protein